MTRFLLLLSGLVFAAGSLSAGNGDDFLFIIADDQSAARFRSNVRPNPTSKLDRYALEGTVFRQAYCPASLCNPSRTAILTCQPADLTGIFRNGNDPRSLATVLHHLKSEGYRLRASGKIFHKGFERNDAFARVGNLRRKGGVRVEWTKPGTGGPLKIGVSRVEGPEDLTARRADWMIREIRRSKPFQKNGFLVGFSATHLPFYAPASRRYAKAYRQRRIRLPVAIAGPIPALVPELDRKFRLSARRRREVIARYYGCLRYVADQSVRVIRQFRSKYPSGHVVYLSDHGFLLGEGGSWGKTSTLEFACRVPYIVWSKDLPRGGVEGPISTGTVFPLLLDLCGVPEFPDAHWKSPRAWIEAGRTPPGHVVTTYAGLPERYRETEGATVRHFKNREVFVTNLEDRPIVTP